MAGGVSEIPLNRRIGLIVLRPDVSRVELERLLGEADGYGCAWVGVTGSRVEVAAARLADSAVKVAALVGFPFGAGDADVKRYEVEAAVDAGAQEIHCVVNAGWVRDGWDAGVLRELRDVREAADERPVTAVAEWALLTPEERRRLVGVVLDAEVQFLATATGCGTRKATPDDLRELREWSGPELGLTAVGGLQSEAEVRSLVDAGANRVGLFTLAGLGVAGVG